MVKLLQLSVKNVIPFESATLDLAYEGITLIRGVNKDAGPGATNAAGKSALIGGLAELVLDESPSGKTDKLKKTKGTKTKKVEISVKLQHGKHVYDVTKTMNGGKSYEILKDGKTLNTRTVQYNQQRIAGLFNMPEAQFYSRFYIDSTIPHPLIVGKASTRQEYIVELFNLNDIDSIRKLLNVELNAVSKKGIELRTIKSNIDDLKQDLLPKTERETSKDRLAELTADQAKLTRSLQESQAVAELVNFGHQHRGLIKDLKNITTLDDLPQVYKTTKAKVQGLKDLREAVTDWKTYDRLVRLYEKASEPATTAMDSAGLEIRDVHVGAETYRQTQANIRQLERGLKDPGPKPKKVDKPDHRRDKCLLRVGALKQELRHIHELKSGVCPVCGSAVNPRSRTAVEAELAKWSRRMDQTELWRSYTEAKTSHTSQQRAFVKETEKIAKLKKRLKKAKVCMEISELLADVPPRPKKPTSAKPIGFNEDKLERLQKKLSILKQGKELLEPIRACQALTRKQRGKAEQASAFLKKLDSINAEVSALTSKLAQQQEIIRRLKSLKERADMLTEECKDEKILKALVGAHSTSGLKKFMIERYSKLLEDQINKYRKIFFSEDYQFEFRYDSKLSLLVYRRYGKRVSVSDVKKLSGAEKRLFTLLLVVATTTMLPISQRTNVLILDEPESNMGAAFVDQLIKSLPLLNKLVPHIVFVTPRTELEIPNSRVLTVVKHHGIAKLEVSNG
jgi:DNA repair exonuclease SbcCD ATPase subunit